VRSGIVENDKRVRHRPAYGGRRHVGTCRSEADADAAAGRDFGGAGDLNDAVVQGRVREDLYYRLNAVRLRMPPLRERREDIPLLFASLLARAQIGPDGVAPAITDEVRSRLLESSWPGNIRELSHFAQRFALGLESRDARNGVSESALADRVASFESRILKDTLEALGGDVAEALIKLKIPRKTLYDKLKRHGLKPADFRRR
jgi:two-component system C4-dicarboxylate transport response regulator DctD